MIESAPAYSHKHNATANKLAPEDRPIHDWYRFVLSFPPHLVREYLQKFGIRAGQTVLDPFCGTGTTLVECKKLGIASVGVEAIPFVAFASDTKAKWDVDSDALRRHAHQIATRVADSMEVPFQGRLHSLSPAQMNLLLSGSISPLPLHKTLILLEAINAAGNEFACYERLALANCLVTDIGNLNFGPEVGVTKPKADAPVLELWLAAVNNMASDLAIQAVRAHRHVPTVVHCSDARDISAVLPKCSVDAVITSPPYPNEKDYTRTTRLESVILGFLRDKTHLRQLKQGLVRSNTRTVYKDDNDDAWIAGHDEIMAIADSIEKRRIELGKTSGFERLYPRVAKLYFGGMARHLSELRAVLKPGAQLAYVVGDQASYLRVMIRTGELLADIAESMGYEVIGLDLFRTRLATATKQQLREEVVLLRWPG